MLTRPNNQAIITLPVMAKNRCIIGCVCLLIKRKNISIFTAKLTILCHLRANAPSLSLSPPYLYSCKGCSPTTVFYNSYIEQNQPNPFIQLQICLLITHKKETSAYLRPSLPFYAMTKNQHLCKGLAWLPFQ